MDRNFISFWQYKICGRLSPSLSVSAIPSAWKMLISFLHINQTSGIYLKLAERQHNITFLTLSLLLLPCTVVFGIRGDDDGAAAGVVGAVASFLSLRCATAN